MIYMRFSSFRRPSALRLPRLLTKTRPFCPQRVNFARQIWCDSEEAFGKIANKYRESQPLPARFCPQTYKIAISNRRKRQTTL